MTASGKSLSYRTCLYCRLNFIFSLFFGAKLFSSFFYLCFYCLSFSFSFLRRENWRSCVRSCCLRLFSAGTNVSLYRDAVQFLLLMEATAERLWFAIFSTLPSPLIIPNYLPLPLSKKRVFTPVIFFSFFEVFRFSRMFLWTSVDCIAIYVEWYMPEWKMVVSLLFFLSPVSKSSTWSLSFLINVQT